MARWRAAHGLDVGPCPALIEASPEFVAVIGAIGQEGLSFGQSLGAKLRQAAEGGRVLIAYTTPGHECRFGAATTTAAKVSDRLEQSGKCRSPLVVLGCGGMSLAWPREVLAHPTRFERVTPTFGGWCSIQLSYGCLFHCLPRTPSKGQRVRPSSVSPRHGSKRDRLPRSLYPFPAPTLLTRCLRENFC